MKRLLHLLPLLAWLTAAAVTAWPHGAWAANFNYDTDVTYRLDAQDHLQVTEKYHVTNHTDRFYLTEITLTTPSDSLTGLKVNYDDGGSIPATTTKKAGSKGDIQYDYQQIHIVFPRTIYGNGKTWNFTVTYQATGLVDTKGSAHTVYLPSIDPGDAGNDYKATVDVPAGYGPPHFSGAPSSGASSAGDRQLYSFNKADLVQNALALAFGDSTVYKLNFNFPLRNDSPLPRTLTVALPPDLASQRSYIDKLDPAPANLHLDDDGNVLADYRLRPHQSLIVHTDIAGQVRYLDYDLTKSGKKADIPADLVRRYTKSSQYWPTTGPVRAAAAKLNDDNAPVVNNVKAMYQYTIDHLSYNRDKIKFNVRQGADKALANPNNAVCLEYADLLIAMLRSQGIPARMTVGYGYSGSLKTSPAVSDSLHAWVEAYVPGIGWMSLDPTWGEKFDQFGKSDLDHFAFAVWGEHDQSPDAVMTGGFDQGYQYEAAQLSYAATVQPAPPIGRLAVTRLALLPFLSLDHVDLTGQSRTSSDHNFVVIAGRRLELGSLAPAQKVSLNRLVWGTAWSRSDPAELDQVSAGPPLVLAAGHAQVTYLPLAVLAALAVGWLSLAVLRLRSNRRITQPGRP